MDQIEGRVIFAQESRFLLVDRGGVAHHFVLSHAAGADPEQLPALQRVQARVRVGYKPAGDLIAHAAMRITLLDDA
jgi:hypothetical protein